MKRLFSILIVLLSLNTQAQSVFTKTHVDEDEMLKRPSYDMYYADGFSIIKDIYGKYTASIKAPLADIFEQFPTITVGIYNSRDSLIFSCDWECHTMKDRRTALLYDSNKAYTHIHQHTTHPGTCDCNTTSSYLSNIYNIIETYPVYFRFYAPALSSATDMKIATPLLQEKLQGKAPE